MRSAIRNLNMNPELWKAWTEVALEIGLQGDAIVKYVEKRVQQRIEWEKENEEWEREKKKRDKKEERKEKIHEQNMEHF